MPGTSAAIASILRASDVWTGRLLQHCVRTAADTAHYPLSSLATFSTSMFNRPTIVGMIGAVWLRPFATPISASVSNIARRYIVLELHTCGRCNGTGFEFRSRSERRGEADVQTCESCNGIGLISSERSGPSFVTVCLVAMFVISLIAYVSPEFGAVSVLMVLAISSWGLASQKRI
jgi:hypothetical protein